jgi:TatD DNase family protein
MSVLPPLDAHTHIDPAIDERELRALRSVLFAVTREPAEWDAAVARRDRQCAWGLGCHPGLPRAFASFDIDRFIELMMRVPLVGEVGLDRRSKVPMAQQREVFRRILRAVAERPRPVSIHSVGAASEVLDELRACPLPGAVLHWWRGSPDETRSAVQLGCFFSLNGAELSRPKVIGHLPRDRVLTETDFPHTQRQDREARRPGRVGTIERALGSHWEVDAASARQQVWSNLAALVSATDSARLMPRGVQATLLGLPAPAPESR